MPNPRPHIPGMRHRLKMKCPPPHPRSVSGGGDEPIVFTLDPGDGGRCRSDPGNRTERVEGDVTRALRAGRIHRVRLRLSLDEGFSGREECFVQIMGWNKTCKCGPLLMLQAHQGRIWTKIRRYADLSDYPAALPGKRIAEPGMDHVGHPVTIAGLLGRQIPVDITLDRTGDVPRIAVALDGTALASERACFVHPGATPAIRVGIYRPQGAGTSRSVLRLHWTGRF